MREVAQLLSCENLDEIRQWFAEDRSLLDRRQAGEYVALRADLQMDEIQIMQFVVSLQ
jgi:hypothetical protein